MSRFLFQYLLPLLLPFLIYLAWVALSRGRRPGWLDDTPWVPLAMTGVGLLAISLISWSLLTGSDPSARYQPPRFEDGRVVPAEAVEPE
jgi:hypothetical protein